MEQVGIGRAARPSPASFTQRIYKPAGTFQTHSAPQPLSLTTASTPSDIRTGIMMRGTGGGLIVALATLLVFCKADTHQEQDVGVAEHASGERYEGNDHKARALGLLGSGNLARDVREIRHSSYFPYIVRKYEYNGKREPWPMAPIEYSGYYADGFPKRNFDEIDRSSLNTFVKKRNFDEIDRSSMPFPYATKRFYQLYGPHYLDLDIPVSSFDKKRYRPDFPMDEIDLSHFPIGSKRSQDYPLAPAAV